MVKKMKWGAINWEKVSYLFIVIYRIYKYIDKTIKNRQMF